MVSLVPGMEGRLLLKGVDPDGFASAGSLYQVRPLAPCTQVLLLGTLAGLPQETASGSEKTFRLGSHTAANNPACRKNKCGHRKKIENETQVDKNYRLAAEVSCGEGVNMRCILPVLSSPK